MMSPRRKGWAVIPKGFGSPSNPQPTEWHVRDYKARQLNGREIRLESLMMSYGYDQMLSEGAALLHLF